MPSKNDNAVEVLLSEREVSALLGVSRWTLWRWRRDGAVGQLPCIKIGRAIRYRLRDVATAVALRAR